MEQQEQRILEQQRLENNKIIISRMYEAWLEAERIRLYTEMSNATDVDHLSEYSNSSGGLDSRIIKRKLKTKYDPFMRSLLGMINARNVRLSTSQQESQGVDGGFTDELTKEFQVIYFPQLISMWKEQPNPRSINHILQNFYRKFNTRAVLTNSDSLTDRGIVGALRCREAGNEAGNTVWCETRDFDPYVTAIDSIASSVPSVVMTDPIRGLSKPQLNSLLTSLQQVLGEDPTDKDIIIPYADNIHWRALHLVVREGKFTQAMIVDSMSTSDQARHAKYIRHCLNTVFGESLPLSVVNRRVQRNNYSCGDFVMQYFLQQKKKHNSINPSEEKIVAARSNAIALRRAVKDVIAEHMHAVPLPPTTHAVASPTLPSPLVTQERRKKPEQKPVVKLSSNQSYEHLKANYENLFKFSIFSTYKSPQTAKNILKSNGVLKTQLQNALIGKLQPILVGKNLDGEMMNQISAFVTQAYYNALDAVTDSVDLGTRKQAFLSEADQWIKTQVQNMHNKLIPGSNVSGEDIRNSYESLTNEFIETLQQLTKKHSVNSTHSSETAWRYEDLLNTSRLVPPVGG